MKKIVFTRADGGVSVMGPCEGARLAYSVTLPDGSKFSSQAACPVDTFLRRWPVDGASVEWAETIDEFYARIIAKDVPKDATNLVMVNESEIPQDRTFRDALAIIDEKIVYDMPKCREIHKEKLRQLRAPKLSALDVEFMRAVEAGDIQLQQDIGLRKQALRDVTAVPELTSAATPEALKLVIPDVLT